MSAKSCEDSTGQPYGFVLALAKQAVAAFRCRRPFRTSCCSEKLIGRLKGITKTTAGGLSDTPAVVCTGSPTIMEPEVVHTT